MTATGHALIGVVIAAKIGNPYVALPIAFVSHIFADLMPHWDAGTRGEEKTKKQITIEAIGDVLVSFIASYLLIYFVFPKTDLIYAFIVIIAAQGLDWLTAPYYFLGIKKQPFIFFHAISSMTNTRLDKPWGILTQVATVLILITIALTA